MASQAQDRPMPDSLERDSLLSTQLSNVDTSGFIGGEDQDTTKPTNRPEYEISSDAIEEKVIRYARDSSFFDRSNNVIHLYGNAWVEYESIKITAGYIALRMDENLAIARGHEDSTGEISAYPFVEMEGEEFVAKEIKYNFKSQKGKITDIFRKEQDLFVRGGEAKVVNEEKNDTVSKKTSYLRDAVITTCDHPLPHYGIRSQKQKLILDEVAIVGPSNLEFNGVPSPVWLPFGFFPLSKQKSTGLLFPRNYEKSGNLGFGFKDVGWYFPINDYIDFQVTTDLYLRGSFAIKTLTRYKKRYKYSGSVNIEYFSYKKEGIQNERVIQYREPSFNIRIDHRQDAKAHPTRTLGGSVNIQTNSFKELTSTSPEAQLNNTLRSNFNFTQRFPDANLTLTAGLSHNQNTKTHDLSLSLPDVSLRMNQAIYPFKRKVKSSKERWYEQIRFKYDAAFKNNIRTKDTTLFRLETLEDMQFGLEQKANTNITFNLLNHINITPNVNFTEIWYWRTTRKELLDEYEVKIDTVIDPNTQKSEIIRDTLKYGVVDERNVWGFEPLHIFDASISANTAIYGTVRFRKGWLRGLRHTVKPTIGFSYAPDYTNPRLDYFRYHHTDLREKEDELKRYSIFENGVFRSPSTSGQEMRLNMGINNVFDAKIFSKRDSAEKNINLLPTLNIRSNYNFSADSLKLAPISFSTNFQLIKNFSTVSINGSFTAYDRNKRGEAIDRFLYREGKGLLRFVGMMITVNTGFTMKQMFDYIDNLTSDEEIDSSPNKNSHRNGDPSLRNLLGNFRINHSLNMNYEKLITGDTLYVRSHELNMNGRLAISKNWNIDIGRLGYSFSQKRITYPSLGFSRDIHCWNMGVTWQPEVQTYNFFIRVDPGTFGFIDVPYRKSQLNNRPLF